MQLPTFLYAILTSLTPACAVAAGITANDTSLLWGPYRSNLYLGIRPRVPESLLMGLMWGKHDGENMMNFRHACEPSDAMAGYGWTTYDSRNGGTQTIQDVGNALYITTEFVKLHQGEGPGNWGLRVKGTPRGETTSDSETTVVFYVAMEAMEGCTDCHLEATVRKQGTGDGLSVDTVDLDIKHPKLGVAGLHITNPKGADNDSPLNDAAVKSFQAPEDMLWQSKCKILPTMNSNFLNETVTADRKVIPNEPGVGNMHFVQFVFKNGFEFDILYSTQSATRSMTSGELTTGLRNQVQSFETQFSDVFKPQIPFLTDSHTSFAHNLLSNLLGGLGYFYGTTQVDLSHSPEYEEVGTIFWKNIAEAQRRAKPETKGPSELFTHVPSRPGFSRGFLWDEGFHLLLVQQWDMDLAIEVLQSWLALMDSDGWIAREQVPGAETQSKIPRTFLVQYPHIANPPTLFWVVSKYLDVVSGKTKYSGRESTLLSDSKKSKALIAELFLKLKRHYNWFRRTQAGDVEVHSVPRASLNEGYRWRGRTPNYNLASGLDDFPRAEPPDVTELHVDALCWVGVMAETLERLALLTENNPDIVTFQNHQRAINQNIEAVHWSTENAMYCDTRVLDDTHTYVCPIGYVALIPFMTGFIGPEHPHLNATLDLLRDPAHLWTAHGIRSLSPENPSYGTGDNYWRSPIWINMNYLLIERLLLLARRRGPAQARCRQLYSELRVNVVDMVFRSWQETSVFWEQYDPVGGHGQGTKHFTGWTALVVQIMAFPDLESEAVGAGAGGVKETIGGWVNEVKEVGVGVEQDWGAASLVAILMLCVFLYVTRRRFAGLVRGLRRG
ncbi:glycoside hydrolase [Massariosphaeria phaeospora]|uniref:Mannosyl-oligosaccharide glucosidase n=1 Tax=Massariosphaeria phaeospora TaxID=100035 RepID=A0A7C8M765_9PLEO|nr:glycoside hydrolase [Massariosphaeria phaeospora]